MSEQELLKSFVRDGDEQAFRQLVDRHTGLVYAGALRRVGSGHVDDVVQAVFLVLARKSPSLAKRRDLKLAAWLHVTTGFVAREALRAEARRQKRDTAAYTLDAMNRDAVPQGQDWEDVRPHIDAALDRLSATDREAVISRFFRDESFGEISTRLGTRPNTATKRVSRALERMRRYLEGRGVRVAIPALSLMMAAQRTHAAAQLQGARALGAAAIGDGVSEAVTGMAELSMSAALVSQVKALAPVAILAFGLLGAGGTLAIQQVSASRRPFDVSAVAPVELSLEGFARLPDGAIAYQINARRGQRTYFVKPGDTLEGYTLSATPGGASNATAHSVQLVKGTETLDLVRERMARTSHRMALIGSETAVTDWIREGETFDTAKGRYVCESIETDGSHIVVSHVDSGQRTRVRVR